ncbi:hypothetical protein EU805_02320 [Salipiger sp. IMCC34102]|uniref:capsular polysaccharide export protein, LipB/KpsS family n=1 Tax=Salipiger sp. IMCC34102 TaxID=2510647 RepID=UPI00101C3C4D|nr:hypothetical protein [Salipiger sp. IMCC34102]RYH04229.1 hypothetical protein EU805_02320 [Salipiger sp. IMCC34102]
MDQPTDVVFYLDRPLLNAAREGRHNFLGLVSKALTDAGLRVLLELNTREARAESADRPGYSLFHMDEPFHARALTVRRNYFYPFWQIERSSRRWEWTVALSKFKPDAVDRQEADRFADFWRHRLFPDVAPQKTPDGPIYMPLQGRIQQHRSFQSFSPVEMIRRTACRMPDRDIVLTLHPGERYGNADITALEEIEGQHPNVAVSARPPEQLLPRCSAVVTQNSSVALKGFFFRKPAVVFGQIDFHHIAGNVPMEGEERAFADLDRDRDYAGYLWWFLQKMSINAGRPEALDKITATFRQHGWPV